MKKVNKKKPIISALEQRILFDGAAVATAVDVLDNSSFTASSNDATTNNDVTSNNAENSVHGAQATQSFERDRREVAFVDSSVEDFQTLVDGIKDGVEIFVFDGSKGGVDQITSILQNQTNIDAIHILSHGSTGEITLGTDKLNSDTLSKTVLSMIQSSIGRRNVDNRPFEKPLSIYIDEASNSLYMGIENLFNKSRSANVMISAFSQSFADLDDAVGEEKAKIHNYTEPKLYLEKLYNDGYVNFKESENAYQINLNGIEFINNGGYKAKARSLCYKKTWNIIKIVAVFLNAIILLIFAYFSFIKDQKDDDWNNKKELKIENQIDTNKTTIKNKNGG